MADLRVGMCGFYGAALSMVLDDHTVSSLMAFFLDLFG